MISQQIVAIRRQPGVDYLRAVFAAWDDRKIALPLDSGADLAELGVAIDRTVETCAGGGWVEGRFIGEASSDGAQIVHTSGTTGAPKAMLLSRRAVSDVVERLIEVMALDSSVREYVAVPVTYSFGLGRARAIAAVGGRAFIPDQGFRPDEFARMLTRGEVNSLAAVPTMLRAILARPGPLIDCGDRLKWLEVGSQHMSRAEKLAIAKLFPAARIVQHYGLTEASRTTFLTIDSSCPEALDSVGAPTGDVKVKIDEQGRIAIRGPHLADGILSRGRIAPITDRDGWLHTADLGQLVGGRLHFEGRSDDVANISGIKVSADRFERALAGRAQLPADRYAVVVRDDALRGQILVIAHTADVDGALLRSAANATAAEHNLGVADFVLALVDAIPRTETGKVQRGRLAELTVPSAAPTSSEGCAEATDPQMSDAEAEIARIWQQVLGVDHIGPNDSFFDLGGDSLSVISAVLRAEQLKMPSSAVQDMLDGRTVAEIASDQKQAFGRARPPRSGMAAIGDATNALRGVLVLLVIAAHWSPFFFERLGPMRTWSFAATFPIFRMGTPGFAMVFGVGLALFYLPALDRAPARVRKKMRANRNLLGSGVLLIAVVKAVELIVIGRMGERWPEILLYEVLLFYLLFMTFGEPLLRGIARARHRIFAALMVGLVSLAVLLAIKTFWPIPDHGGWLRLLWHMAAAPYSIPQMLVSVSLGLALGLWVYHHRARDDLLVMLGWLGALLLVGGAILVAVYGGGWWVDAGRPPSLPAYLGVLALGLAGFLILTIRGWMRRTSRLLIVIGLLAFPAFVVHSLVIPIKEIAVASGMSYAAAMTLAVAGFALVALYAIGRVHRIYFHGDAADKADLV